MGQGHDGSVNHELKVLRYSGRGKREASAHRLLRELSDPLGSRLAELELLAGQQVGQRIHIVLRTRHAC